MIVSGGLVRAIPFRCAWSSYLTASLSTVGKSRNGDAAVAICNIDTLRVFLKRERNAQLLDGVKIQIILLVAVEGQEYVKAG